jgi:hypothetical protein
MPAQKSNTDYIETQCIPISTMKEEIKKGKFDDMNQISNVSLYKNVKKQWRFKFTLENDTKQKTKNFNLLASVLGKDVFVNKKSFDYAAESLLDEDQVSQIAEDLLSS